jgi:predicted NBD/HSP70 family sugar kinase
MNVRRLSMKLTRDILKDHNEKIVLRTIRQMGEVSRTTISKKTGLSIASITNITSRLLEANLIKENRYGKSKGGRRPVLLGINEKHSWAIGVKVGYLYLYFVVTDLLGTPVLEQKIPLNTASYNAVVEKIADFVNTIVKIPEYVDRKFLGIGVAVSGSVDSEHGIVKSSYILEWGNVPIGPVLEERIKAPVLVYNDVDSFAVAHYTIGRAKKYKNCIFITLGSGVGGAMILDGKLYTGRGGAGEIGHMTVICDGKKCSCGSYGCLEAEISFNALVDRIKKKTNIESLKNRSCLTTEDEAIHYIHKALQIDREAVIEAFDEISVLLGVAIKNMINIFAPDYVLIGGEALEFRDLFLKKAILIARENSFGDLGDDVVIDIDDMGEVAWVQGVILNLIEKEVFQVDGRGNTYEV